MTNKGPFPFQTIKEAWDYFDRAASLHFIRLIKQEMENNPEIRSQAKLLRNRDYCARVLYILNMFAYEGNKSSEFDLDWAMLIARPLSSAQAKRSIDDLIAMGLMTKGHDIERNFNLDERSTKPSEDVRQKRTENKRGRGDNETRETKFNFD